MSAAGAGCRLRHHVAHVATTMRQLFTQEVMVIYTCYWSHTRYRVMSRWHPMICVRLHITELVRLRESRSYDFVRSVHGHPKPVRPCADGRPHLKTNTAMMVDIARLVGRIEIRMPDDAGDRTNDSKRRAVQVQTRIRVTNLLKTVVLMDMPRSTKSTVDSGNRTLLEPD